MDERIGIRYRPTKTLHSGGMAEVILAQDRLHDRNVVVKISLNNEGQENAALENEFSILSSLSHDCLPEVYDFGRTGDGKCFITLEVLNAVEWFSPIRIFTGEKRIQLIFQLLDLLEYLHFHEVVHLDIKPWNLLRKGPGETEDAHVKLIDFGLASSIPAQAEWGELTGTGAFMSPEVIKGLRVDHRADLYSLGATLYYVFTGREPFSGSGDSLLKRIVHSPPPLPSSLNSSIPEALDSIVMKLLNPDPEKRPQSALEVHDAFQKIFPLHAEEVQRHGRKKRPKIHHVIKDSAGVLLSDAVKLIRKNRGACVIVQGERGTGRSHFLKQCIHSLCLRGWMVIPVEDGSLIDAMNESAGKREGSALIHAFMDLFQVETGEIDVNCSIDGNLELSSENMTPLVASLRYAIQKKTAKQKLAFILDLPPQWEKWNDCLAFLIQIIPFHGVLFLIGCNHRLTPELHDRLRAFHPDGGSGKSGIEILYYDLPLFTRDDISAVIAGTFRMRFLSSELVESFYRASWGIPSVITHLLEDIFRCNGWNIPALEKYSHRSSCREHLIRYIKDVTESSPEVFSKIRHSIDLYRCPVDYRKLKILSLVIGESWKDGEIRTFLSRFGGLYPEIVLGWKRKKNKHRMRGHHKKLSVFLQKEVNNGATEYIPEMTWQLFLAGEHLEAVECSIRWLHSSVTFTGSMRSDMKYLTRFAFRHRLPGEQRGMWRYVEGLVAYRSGNLRRSLDRLERAAGDLTPPHPCMPELLLDSAKSAARSGNYDHALSSIEKASCIVQHKGNRNPRWDLLRLRLMIHRANVLLGKGDIDNALEFWRKRLSVLKLAEYPQQDGDLESFLGNLYIARREMKEAEIHHLNALNIRKTLGDDSRIADSYNNLGILYWRIGNPKEARTYWTAALRLRKEQDDLAEAASCLDHLGILSYQKGEMSRSVERFRHALTIRRYLRDSRGIASSCNNLGLLHHARHDCEKAVEFFQEALRIRKRLHDRRGSAEVMNNLGLTALRSHDYSVARRYFRASLSLRQNGKNRAGILNPLMNLGSLEYRSGRWDSAEEYYLKTLEASEKSASSKGEALALEGIGLIRYGRGSYEEACTYLSNAAHLHTISNEEVRWVKSVIHWAEALLSSGDTVKSLEVLQQVEERVNSLKEPGLLAPFFRIHSSICLKSDEIHRAREFYRKGTVFVDTANDAVEMVRYRILDIVIDLPRDSSDPLDVEKIEEMLQSLLRVVRKEGEPHVEMTVAAMFIWMFIRAGEAAMAFNLYRSILEKIRILKAEKRFRDLMRELGEYSGHCISAARTPEEGTLSRIAELINTITNPELLLSRILDIALVQVGAERGLLTIIDSSTGELEVKVSRNLERETILDALQYSRNIIQQTYESEEVLYSSNAQEDSLFKDFKSVFRYNITSFACVPIKQHGNVIGTIYLDNRSLVHSFEPADISFLRSFSYLAAITIENSRLHASVKMEKEAYAKAVQRRIDLPNIIGRSPEIEKLFGIIDRVGKGDVPVLLQGETGTGKGLFARRLHFLSSRVNGPFVEVDCGSIPPTLIESELFGHKKGAFTGAVQDKSGLMETANGGTLFLDEITNLNLSLQVRLLGVLQRGYFRRVGETEKRRADIRVICASNKDIDEEIEKGKFRKDLAYRINAVILRIPPLRERSADISLLVNHYVKVFSDKFRKQAPVVNAETMRLLNSYSWPGNVRELKNLLERLVLLGEKNEISPDDLPHYMCADSRRSESSESHMYNLKQLENRAILSALEKTGGVQIEAAELLGISERNLRYKMKKHGIRSRRTKR
jgi:Nif-specific regulatory protein